MSRLSHRNHVLDRKIADFSLRAVVENWFNREYHPRFDNRLAIVRNRWRLVDIQPHSMADPFNARMLSEAALFDHISTGLEDLLGGDTRTYTVAHSSQITAGWNTAFYKNADLDKLLEEGRVTTEATKRKELYARVEEHIVKNVPYIPYYVIKRAFLTTGNVRGFMLDVRAFEVFHDAWISH